MDKQRKKQKKKKENPSGLASRFRKTEISGLTLVETPKRLETPVG